MDFDVLKEWFTFENIMELINDTASNPSIIEMCGHAMYIGSKTN